MMIEPRASRLLRRVCDSMEASTQDARELRAALWVLRDLASRIDGHAQAVQADIDDMEAVLRALPVTSSNAGGGDACARHLRLQQQLQDAAQALRRDPESQTMLRAVHLRMLERERALLGDPGGNPSLKTGSASP